MKNLLLILALLTTTWLFNSCKKDETFKENAIEENVLPEGQDNQGLQATAQFRGNSEEPYTILGMQRENPFTVANINLAKTNLYGASIPAKSSTHRYVKFLPTAQEHLAYLEEWETTNLIPMFDFPLEYEIVTAGEYYIDPSVSDSIYTYRYASIPNGVDLPAVPYEIIDELYLVKSNPLLLAESFRITDNADDIQSYILNYEGIDSADLDEDAQALVPPMPDCDPGCIAVLTIDESQVPLEYIWECDCNPPSGGGGNPPLNACSCPIPSNHRNPAGCVQVENDFGMVPVQNASIKVRDDWFNTDYTYTNATGCWRVDDNYSGKVKMWVKFKNSNVKVRDARYWNGTRAVEDYVGKFTSPPYNNILVVYSSGASDNTSNARMYWAAAHTLNTVNEYRTWAAVDGVPLPRTGLNWTNQQGTGDASAPMLQGNPYNSWPTFLFISSIDLGYLVALQLLPDISNKYYTAEPAGLFNGSGFHELGHASHHGLAGETYWVDYRNHIINNQGYGSFGNFANNSDPGKVALGEAIGNFTGAIYGSTSAGGEGSQWSSLDNFIPQGLMWDLGDTNIDVVTDPNTGIGGSDNISGFTRNMIFNALSPNVNNIRDFRDRLRVLHLADTPNTAAAYNTFVDIYDVFN